jgi:hypothetical protein
VSKCAKQAENIVANFPHLMNILDTAHQGGVSEKRRLDVLIIIYVVKTCLIYDRILGVWRMIAVISGNVFDKFCVYFL